MGANFERALRASQAISKEIVFDRLVETTMAMVIEHSGATDARLFLDEDGRFRLAAVAGIDQRSCVQTASGVLLDDAGHLAPLELLHQVQRSRCTAVIDDADDDEHFAQDPYVSHRKLRSAACIPILLESQLTGLLYLESASTRCAFGKERSQTLEVIAAQAAISLENARRYETESKAKQELRRQHDRLERAIEEHVHAEAKRQDVERQQRESQKLEAIGQLAGGLSHGFNNVLTAILGTTELCRDELGPELGSDHQALAYLDDIEDATMRAGNLTRQLLTFCRKNVVNAEILNINRILLDLDKILRRLVSEDIAVTMDLQPDPDPIWADGGQLEQVIINLVLNAAQAMPEGGQLRVKTEHATLDAGHTRLHPDAKTGEHLVLAVSDTGHGMDRETQDRIFEPFFTTKPVDRGTGLGLSTVHGIVMQAGGHIVVYSEAGLGTTFKVYLPTLADEPITPDEESRAPVSPAGSETILVCEDERLVRELTAKMLGNAGYSVRTSSHGAEALALARQHEGEIDLLLTDVIMPGMDGCELSERLGIPTLFMSGYAADVLAHHGLMEGEAELLEKPFGQRALLSRVRKLLDSTRG